REQGNVEDAKLRRQQSVERIREAARADVRLQRLPGERLEDPLEMPLTQPAGLRDARQRQIFVEARLDVVDALLDTFEVVAHAVRAGAWKKPVIATRCPSPSYSP